MELLHGKKEGIYQMKIKFYVESDYNYQLENMEEAINSFSSKHKVLKIDTTTNADEEITMVVVYEEK